MQDFQTFDQNTRPLAQTNQNEVNRLINMNNSLNAQVDSIFKELDKGYLKIEQLINQMQLE